ncbi:MAG: AAA family ATPase [Patescibacteria group bacterium]|jgi:adenylate kinase family enzyme
MRKVLILTGPGGAGKTTIADLLVKRRGFNKVDGDYLDSEFFPEGRHWVPENFKKLKQAHDKIFAETKKIFNQGENNVVIDYIIFGHYLEFFKKFKKEFGDNLEIKVLFPTKEETIKRDKERECWTAGIERISAVRAEFEAIRSAVGSDNFFNTTGQTPDETFEKYFKD